MIATARLAAVAGPVHTTVIPFSHDGRPATTLVRVWEKADADACTLCPLGECRVRRGPRLVGRDGRKTAGRVCDVSFEGTVDPADAPLFSMSAVVV